LRAITLGASKQLLGGEQPGRVKNLQNYLIFSTLVPGMLVAVIALALVIWSEQEADKKRVSDPLVSVSRSTKLLTSE
jgi:hypothetical protein